MSENCVGVKQAKECDNLLLKSEEISKDLCVIEERLLGVQEDFQILLDNHNSQKTIKWGL